MMKVFFEPDDMCTTLKIEVKRIHDFFIANDCSVTTDSNEADLIIVPTCSGWQKLFENSIERLKKYNQTGKKVVSLGCVNATNPSEVNEVHKGPIIQTQQLDKIEALVSDLRVRLHDIKEPSTFRSKEDYRLYDLRKRFVNITFGCPFSCSYCPHKQGLGPLKSRKLDSILNQIDDLVHTTEVKIIVLTGMETSNYGRDIGETYPGLLKKVIDLHDSYDIHVAQFHPSGLKKYSKELVDLFSNPRITDIQIPIQTTSSRILKLMHRPPIDDDFFSNLKIIKDNNSRVILRTDIIVGFPTETEEEFEKSLSAVSTIFDEVALYAIEIRNGSALEKKGLKELPKQEINQKIAIASKYLQNCGVLVHGGQQSDGDLVDLEQKKQLMRKQKHCDI